MWAAAEGHIRINEGLHSCDAKIDVTTKDGQSALYFACMFGRYNVAKYLIDAGPESEDASLVFRPEAYFTVRKRHLEFWFPSKSECSRKD